MAPVTTEATPILDFNAKMTLYAAANGSILDVAIPPYIPHFKNPCWLEEVDAETHTTRLACMPAFYLAGFPKCGTTDLYSKLVAHPDIARTKKEFHFWTMQLFKSWNLGEYFKHMRGAIEQVARRCTTKEPCPMLIGDGTPATIWRDDFWKRLPGNEGLSSPAVRTSHLLHHFVPKAKFVVLIRDPIERIYSHYLYMGGESTDSFHKEIINSTEKFISCLEEQSLLNCIYGNHCGHGPVWDRLRTSIYHVHLENWFEVYPRDNFHIVSTEYYHRNNTRVVEDVFDFLGVVQPDEKYIRKISKYRKANARGPNLSKIGPMENRTRDYLQKFFKPYNNRLMNLLKWPLDYWGY